MRGCYPLSSVSSCGPRGFSHAPLHGWPILYILWDHHSPFSSGERGRNCSFNPGSPFLPLESMSERSFATSIGSWKNELCFHFFRWFTTQFACNLDFQLSISGFHNPSSVIKYTDRSSNQMLFRTLNLLLVICRRAHMFGRMGVLIKEQAKCVGWEPRLLITNSVGYPYIDETQLWLC